MFFKKKFYALIFIFIAIHGCGGSGNSSSESSPTHTGYVIDAPVANLTYTCGAKTAKTDLDGRFDCSVLPATFFIGNLEIGTIETINTDTKVFVQDIVQVNRNDFNHTKVLKLAILLQSLDSNKSNNGIIHIPDNLILSSPKSFLDLDISEINTLLINAGVTPVSSENAQQHLREFSDIDTLAPKLTLNGNENLSIFKNQTYKELGATVKDDRDKNLSVDIKGTVKVDTLGTYILKYNAVDKAGNKAKEVIRTVTIKDNLPIISNATAIVSITGIAIPNTIFNNTGGAISSCSISPALPAGLTLGNDCTITGTPTNTQATTTYTVTATNATGNHTATVSIQLTAIKIITLFTNNTVNSKIIDDLPDIISCSATPTLPDGLILENDCTITGTPTSISAKPIVHTLELETQDDSYTANFSLSILEVNLISIFKDISVNKKIVDDIPDIISCSATPTLPNGLTLENNCTITGTSPFIRNFFDLVTPAKTLHTIEFKTKDKIYTRNLLLNIQQLKDINLYEGTPANSKIVDDISDIISCSATPTLPVGLTLENNCTITGTPPTVENRTVHTIKFKTKNNDNILGISITSRKLNSIILVEDVPVNRKIVDDIPNIIVCTATPTLPLGLTLEKNCTITGSPTTSHNAIIYAIWFEYGLNRKLEGLSLTITGSKPNISNATDIVSTSDIAVPSRIFKNTGGRITSCSVSPALPTGLTLGNDCTITGSSLFGSQDTKIYTVTASNATGNATATISITINLPTLSINNIINIVNTTGVPIPSIDFNQTREKVTSCSISPALPTGLTLENNCTINGTPTSTQTITTYAVTTSSDTATIITTISITLNTPKPNITNSTNIVSTTAIPIPNINFNRIGTNYASCSISPALPTGLTLKDDCSVVGTPTTPQPGTTHTMAVLSQTGENNYEHNLSFIINNPPFTANDKLLEDQWYIKNTGVVPDTWGLYKNLKKGADMNVTGAWKQGVTGKEIVVTVVDSGINFLHDDLLYQEKLGYHNDLQINVFPIEDYPEVHGTMIAGIIAAEANNGGVAGIAPNTKLISHYLLHGSEFIKNKIKSYKKIRTDDISQVSNHSYGETGNGKLYPQDTEEYDNIKALVTQTNDNKGHVMLFASGNGRINNDYAGLKLSHQNPYIFSISGFDANDQYVTYAEAGPAILVAGATGNRIANFNGIQNIKSPAIATTGFQEKDYVAKPYNGPTHRSNGIAQPKGYVMGANGTSASAPMVTGTVALIRSANPNLTWRDVRWILAKTARKIQLNNANVQYWSKKGNETFGRYSHHFGYGAADAGAAVALAKSPNYKVLPSLEECNIKTTVNEDKTISAIISNECPNTIEFVRVGYSVEANASINDITFQMHLQNNPDKKIQLLKPTTCLDGKGKCNPTSKLNVIGGTIGFLGDTIKEDDPFILSVKEHNLDSTAIVPNSITIMGYNK